jgi:hypothetical protein
VLLESCAAVKAWREAAAQATCEAKQRTWLHHDGHVERRGPRLLPRPTGSGTEAPNRLRPASDLERLIRSTTMRLTTADAVEDAARTVEIIARKCCA